MMQVVRVIIIPTAMEMADVNAETTSCIIEYILLFKESGWG